jgi:cysteinyl-tRNA synthetase
MGAVKLTRDKLARAAGEGDVDSAFAGVIEQHRERFLAAMDDDFNTPQALAVLFDFSREVNTLLNSDVAVSGATLAAIDDLYRRLGGSVLGIIPDDLAPGGDSGLAPQLMEVLIRLRAEARTRKDWATADAIRNELTRIGIALDDRPDGTLWRVIE